MVGKMRIHASRADYAPEDYGISLQLKPPPPPPPLPCRESRSLWTLPARDRGGGRVR